MARTLYFIISILGPLLTIAASQYWASALWLFVFLVPFILIGIYDLTLTKHNVLHNYPVIGHLRYALEFIGPEIRQYFIETNQSGRPFNREIRGLVYARSKGEQDTQPFGTQFDVMENGYHRANHSLSPKKVSEHHARVLIGEHTCEQPYSASRLNVSAMSFGALSSNALRALNAGAKKGNFAHNTGEGGLSPYHLTEGGDIIWQIGTGYFGCRDADGNFDEALFKENAANTSVKMIEIKLSQGAKPAHGGVLPAAKVTEEIASTRGVEAGKDVISPPAHSAFSTPEELIKVIAHLRKISGKPVGFKLCIGNRIEFLGICKAINELGITPDFITVDGSEGGTGAAPIEYTDRLGTPLNEGLVFVNNCLIGIGVKDKIKIIASGKVASGFDIITKIALGADLCNSARAMLFSLGCIQSLRCNTNTCPTGIATQDPIRAKAVNVAEKHIRVANYHNATINSFLEIVGAMGFDDPNNLNPKAIYRRTVNGTESSFAEIYPPVLPGQLLTSIDIPEYSYNWKLASSKSFNPTNGLRN